MSPELRTYRAILQAEDGIGYGFGVRYAIESAAEQHAVNGAEIALMLIEKMVECARARTGLQAMDKADAEIERPNPLTGRRHSAETRAKMSAAATGRRRAAA